MKLAIAAVVIAIGLTGLVNAQGLKPPIRETGKRIALVYGNELYGWCAAYQRIVIFGAGEIGFPGSDREVGDATMCMTYVEAVVDGTPVGVEFNPGSEVRLSEYIAVVTAYLKAHENMREQPAFSLVQNALGESFARP